MAKAQFHKNQRVFVPAVGAWASVERLIPIWSKDFDEPIKITYDVGLGREFRADELRAEDGADPDSALDAGDWRLMRAKNKWQAPGDTAHHPHPGTFPVVVTDPNDWGGWRTPGAEYDRDPHRIEWQARLIAAAPRLLRLAKDLAEAAAEAGEDAPPELARLAETARSLIRSIADAPIRV